MKLKCGRFHVIYTPLSHVTGLINRLAGIGRVQSTEGIDRQKSTVCVGRFTTFLSIQQKGGGDVWVHGGSVCSKK